MPLLRSLSITSLLPVKGSGYKELDTPIQLCSLCPALRRLYLCDSARALNNLAKSVHFPKRLQFMIAFKGDFTYVALSTCIDHLRGAWEVLQTGVQALTSDECHTHWHPFLGRGHQFTFSFDPEKLGGYDSDFSVTFKDPDLSTGEIVLAFRTALDLSSLQAIHIHHSTSMTTSTWKRVFSNLQALHTAGFWCSDVSSFVRALHDTTAGRVNAGDSTSVPGLGFPALRAMDFQESEWALKGASCRFLRAAVNTWPSSRPPTRLDILMCINICKEDVKILQELSPKLQVDWDDHAYYPSEDPDLHPKIVSSEDEEDDWEEDEEDSSD